jgi:hypothetical protein
MSTIKDTALAAIGGRVPRGMGTTAQTALDALIEREQVMADEIIEAGVALGATRDQVAAVVANAGMHMSDYTDDDGGDSGTAEILARFDALEAKVDKAIAKGRDALAWAKTQGYGRTTRRGRRY